MKTTITQIISPWFEGSRTTMQFFPQTRQLWIIQRDNTGATLSRTEHDLGERYDVTLKSATELIAACGWERHDHQIA